MTSAPELKITVFLFVCVLICFPLRIQKVWATPRLVSFRGFSFRISDEHCRPFHMCLKAWKRGLTERETAKTTGEPPVSSNLQCYCSQILQNRRISVKTEIGESRLGEKKNECTFEYLVRNS